MRLRFLCALSLLVAAAMPANALDLSAPLLDDEDKPMCQETQEQATARQGKETECPAARVFTVGKAIRRALYESPDAQSLTGADKDARGSLAFKLTGKTEVKPTPEELVMMRLVIGKAYGPLVVYRLYRILDDQVK